MITSTSVLLYGVNKRGVEFLYDARTYEIVAKRCTECNGWKFSQDFNKSKQGFAGTHSKCRSCHNASCRSWHRDFKGANS